MLGLTADSIKRTIYVGQKDVDRLAKADPKELRELLVDLFGLGEFDRVKDSLKERQARLQGSISELTKQVSAIPTLQLELKSKQTELSSDEGEIERKEDELDKDQALVSRIPSEEALTKLNEVNERLHELQESLTKIETEIKNHLAYLADQQKRTTDFTDMIIALKKDLSVAQSNLTNFPPTETIKVLKDISLRINTLEQQIRNHIRNQRVQTRF